MQGGRPFDFVDHVRSKAFIAGRQHARVHSKCNSDESKLMAIEEFKGKYSFLSNFHRCHVFMDNKWYPSVENAYQAAKTYSMSERVVFETCTSGKAKKLGRKLKLRSDWEQAKIPIMLNLLRSKFQDKELCRLLLATGNEELIEGNWWHDYFWGVCLGVGENWLGKLLMQVRRELCSSMTPN